MKTSAALCGALLLLAAVGSINAYMVNGRRVCRGLERGLTLVGSAAARYNEYRQRYSNCSYIDGNLEITFLDDCDNATNYSLDFLNTVEEISGYLLIYRVCTKVIPLNKLRVIRGNTKFTYKTTTNETYSFSFFVHSNCHKPGAGIEQLQLDNLAEISSGSVHVENNSRLCFLDTILWEDITSSAWTVTNNGRNCPACSAACPMQNNKRRCWASGADHCQKFTKVNCAAQCQGSRCYGPNARECCPPQCAGGCSGPTAWNCTACSKFNNNGECVDSCPPTRRYDPKTMKNEIDPNGMLAYSTMCVKECPQFMGEEDGACVKQCAEKNKMVSNGKCIPCDGPCPKRCSGVHGPDYITSDNIQQFEGCNIVDGSIIIVEATFTDSDKALNFSDLDVLQDVREVTGYVWINSMEVQNLHFLRNLAVIRMQTQNDDNDALYIAKTNISSLELRRLQEIGEDGKVSIQESPMCYVQTMNWTRLLGNSYRDKIDLIDLPSQANCSEVNQTCDERCSNEGCWGPGNYNCLSCKAYRYNEFCLNSCEEIKPLYDAGDQTCERCDAECAVSCSGAGADQCIGGCQHFKWKETCVSECPLGTFADGNNVCQLCHPNCKSCSGPGHQLSQGGCSSCNLLSIFVSPNTTICANTSKCPNGFYSAESMSCWECDRSCRDGCYGPTNSDCFACKSYKLYEEDSTKFACLESCPETHPYDLTDSNNKQEAVCSATPSFSIPIVLGTVIPIVAVIIASVVVTTVYCRKREDEKAERVRLAAQLIGVDEVQPLNPNGQAPDMSQLSIIDESELEVGKPIGNGAFGEVYRGRWKPKNEPNNESVTVAIKVLHDDQVQIQQSKLLQEARVMASVNNRYCLRLIGICLAEKVQLVTALMPFGSLSDYIRRHRETGQIDSRHFATWSLQIAKGMAYLEEKGIVHCDLAARNVLLQRPFLAKITDFGLAKLLGDEPIYELKGGKMPIKWLAIESIEQHIFTSRSDVWSYGVTLWEVCTYGQKPYESYRASEIPDLLHRGNRLEQPKICSIDVYTVMLQCWMFNPQERPSFDELVEKFKKVAADPPRYFAIEGDHFKRQPSTDNPEPDEENGWLAQLEACEDVPDAIVVFDQNSVDMLLESGGSAHTTAALRAANTANKAAPDSSHIYYTRPGFPDHDTSQEYEQPTVTNMYSVPRYTIQPTSSTPPPIPGRGTRKKSNQSVESTLSTTAQQLPHANHSSRNRTESSNSSGNSQRQSTDLLNAISQIKNRQERLPSNSSQATATLNSARPAPAYQQTPTRKHTSSNASSSQNYPNPPTPEYTLEQRNLFRLTNTQNSTMPLQPAHKRVNSSMYPSGSLASCDMQQSFGDQQIHIDPSAAELASRMPHVKAAHQLSTNGISAPQTPMKSNVFQFPAVPAPIPNGVRIPIDDGDYLQPKLSKLAAVQTKQNGHLRNGETTMAHNPDYFVMTDTAAAVSRLQMPANATLSNGRRKNDRRPPNLELKYSDSIEYTNDIYRVRSPKIEELSSLASPAAVKMLAQANARQSLPQSHYNSDHWNSTNMNGSADTQMRRFTVQSNGTLPSNGKVVLVNPLQDSKV